MKYARVFSEIYENVNIRNLDMYKNSEVGKKCYDENFGYVVSSQKERPLKPANGCKRLYHLV